jgi:hypothetical protein
MAPAWQANLLNDGSSDVTPPYPGCCFSTLVNLGNRCWSLSIASLTASALGRRSDHRFPRARQFGHHPFGRRDPPPPVRSSAARTRALRSSPPERANAHCRDNAGDGRDGDRGEQGNTSREDPRARRVPKEERRMLTSPFPPDSGRLRGGRSGRLPLRRLSPADVMNGRLVVPLGALPVKHAQPGSARPERHSLLGVNVRS